MVHTHNLRARKRVSYAPVKEIRKRVMVDVTATMTNRTRDGRLGRMRTVTHSNLFDPEDPRLLTRAGVQELAKDMQREMLSYGWKGNVEFGEWTMTKREVNKDGMLRKGRKIQHVPMLRWSPVRLSNMPYDVAPVKCDHGDCVVACVTRYFEYRK